MPSTAFRVPISAAEQNAAGDWEMFSPKLPPLLSRNYVL